MKKLYTVAIAVLLMSSIAVQADAYYLYNIYPSSYENNNRPDKQKIKIKIKGDDNVINASQYGYFGSDLDKQKLKIKIKGDDNIVTTNQKSYQYPFYSYTYPQPTPAPVPVPTPVPQPNPISYYYYYNNSYSYNPQPTPYYYNYYYNPQPQPQPQNRQPIWNQTSSQSVTSGQSAQFFVSAVDPDGDYLNYSATNLPSGATFNQYTRMFYWTPSVYQTGSYNVNFRVTDNTTYPVDMQVWITVQGNQYSYPNSYSYPYSYSNPSNCYNQIYFTSQASNNNAREGQFYTYTVQTNSQNCLVTYRLISGPAGLSLNQSSGVVSWTPNYNQGGQAYAVTVAASNTYSEATQTFYVYVEGGNVTYESPIQQIEKLKISNTMIQTDANGDVWINWETNKPSTSRVIFDVFSQANKTKDFSYDFATPDDIDLATNHLINLGQLEPNKTFYLRAVSKKGAEVAVSNELTFVKLPCSANNNCLLAGATNYNLSDLLSWKSLFWLMLLIIIILGALLTRSYRRPIVASRLQ